MTRSTFKPSISNGFICMSSQAMRHTTKEQLAWRHLRETEHPEGLSTHATQADQDL
jgi:hypothetical protein